MSQIDLSSSDQWTQRYKQVNTDIKSGWRPRNYLSRVLERALSKGFQKVPPKSILEFGCGDSRWLPYLANKSSSYAVGIDYSPLGCELAKKRLAAENVDGQIHCVNMFDVDTVNIGQHDFVFSLGVVEHFSDLENVLITMLKFVKPGGVLFTEIPNLRSIHGLMSWIWQPKVLQQHCLLTKKQLIAAYQNIGLLKVEGDYCGLFSLNIVAWGFEPRWPRLERRLLPYIRKAAVWTDKAFLGQKDELKPLPFFAPFIYAMGEKPLN